MISRNEPTVHPPLSSPSPSPSSSPSANSIPLVDFSLYTHPPSPSSRQKLSNDLITALRTVGFVYIVNHGIPASSINDAFSMSEKLFALSAEEKMLARHPPSPDWHRGYSGVGVEKVSQVFGEGGGEEDERRGEELRGVRDVKESYEIGSEECKDQPPIWLPHNILPGFKDQTTSFYWQCNTLAQQILSALALGLRLPSEDFFQPFHSGHNNQLRLLHYPQIAASEIERGRAERMPAHTDWGSFTLLFQDECGGLQVQRSRGNGEEEEEAGEAAFVDVEPVDGAVVMNVGDLLMRWSNDALKSTMHRVTLPSLSSRFEGEERMTRERYSIPYFVAPDSEAMVECLEACVPEGERAKYEPIRWEQYRKMRAGLQYKRG